MRCFSSSCRKGSYGSLWRRFLANEMGTEGTRRCGLNRKKGKETYGDEQEGIDVVVVIGDSGGRG